MPTYAFRCPNCASTFDERRTFAHSDDPVTCPSCGGDQAVKQFGTPMVFRRGMAAKALLEAPGRAPVATTVAPAAHASGCPCCSGRRFAAEPAIPDQD